LLVKVHSPRSNSGLSGGKHSKPHPVHREPEPGKPLKAHSIREAGGTRTVKPTQVRDKRTQNTQSTQLPVTQSPVLVDFSTRNKLPSNLKEPLGHAKLVLS